MAEVIGKDEKVSRECSCHGCGARIRYYRNDVKSACYTDYGGGSDTSYWINCPSCCKDVAVSVWY